MIFINFGEDQHQKGCFDSDDVQEFEGVSEQNDEFILIQGFLIRRMIFSVSDQSKFSDDVEEFNGKRNELQVFLSQSKQMTQQKALLLFTQGSKNRVEQFSDIFIIDCQGSVLNEGIVKFPQLEPEVCPESSIPLSAKILFNLHNGNFFFWLM